MMANCSNCAYQENCIYKGMQKRDCEHFKSITEFLADCLRERPTQFYFDEVGHFPPGFTVRGSRRDLVKEHERLETNLRVLTHLKTKEQEIRARGSTKSTLRLIKHLK